MDKNPKKENELIKNPKDIKLLYDLTEDSYSNYILDGSFIIFNSIDNILYLIYLTNHNQIINFNFNDKQKISELKHYHKHYITGFKHFFDKKNKRDLIMSISSEDNNIIIWDIKNLNCILNIVNINKGGVLHSACFLSDKDNYYIVTSNCSQSPFYINFDPIKIFESNGKLFKEINESNEKTYYIDTYYDNTLSKKYIVTCNFNYVKSYDYEKNELYHKYYDKDEGAHFTFNIYNDENNIKLIESSNMGDIRIWNFHSAELLNKIIVNNKRLFSICLWNNDYLFVGCDDGTIKLIEIKNRNIITSLEGHKNIVLTIKKINHSNYGECLVSKGFKEDQIKIWSFKN